MSMSMINLEHLTEEEREQIETVLERDEEERLKEEHRIKKFKSELHALRKKAAIKANGANDSNRTCSRCREPLGLIFNSGELCPKCHSKVCNNCQVFSPSGKTWLCTLCNKQLQLKLGNSHWVPPKSGEISDYPSLHGSQLIRVSLNNSRANSTIDTSEYKASIQDFSEDDEVSYLSEEDEDSQKDSRPNTAMADIHEEPESVSQASGAAETADYQDDDEIDYPMEAEEYEDDISLQAEDANGYASHTNHQVVIDTTPNLRGDEWEQMLNGKLRDASEQEKQNSSEPWAKGAAPPELSFVEAMAAINKVKKIPMTEDDKKEEILMRSKVQMSTKRLSVEVTCLPGVSALVEAAPPGDVDRSSEQVEVGVSASVEAAPPGDVDRSGEQVEVGVSASVEAAPRGDVDRSGEQVEVGKEITASQEGNVSGNIKVIELQVDSTGDLNILNVTSSSLDESHLNITGDTNMSVGKIESESDKVNNNEIKVQMGEGESVVLAEKSFTLDVQDADGDNSEGPSAYALSSSGTNGHTHYNSIERQKQHSNVTRLHPSSTANGAGDDPSALANIGSDDFRKASRTSLSSLYSQADESYRYPVTGDINFALHYNYKTNVFEVKILSCRDLVPVDAKRNKSDPYVKLYLLPDKSKYSKRKTTTKKGTINPVFSETLKYKIRKTELETRTLNAAVWHHDRFGKNLFLGEHLLSLDTVQFDDYAAQWHSLAARTRTGTSTLSYTGDINVAVMYEPLAEGSTNEPDKKAKKSKGVTPRMIGGTLQVHIKECKNLVGVKAGGNASPCCKCCLLPDRSKNGKKRTTVKKKTCNPKWTEVIRFQNVTRDSLLERCLEISVWDHDTFGSGSFMGGIRLGLGSGKSYGKAVDWMDSSGKEVSLWKEMLKHPNHWVETTMTLRPNVGKKK